MIVIFFDVVTTRPGRQKPGYVTDPTALYRRVNGE